MVIEHAAQSGGMSVKVRCMESFYDMPERRRGTVVDRSPPTDLLAGQDGYAYTRKRRSARRQAHGIVPFELLASGLSADRHGLDRPEPAGSERARDRATVSARRPLVGDRPSELKPAMRQTHRGNASGIIRNLVDRNRTGASMERSEHG